MYDFVFSPLISLFLLSLTHPTAQGPNTNVSIGSPCKHLFTSLIIHSTRWVSGKRTLERHSKYVKCNSTQTEKWFMIDQTRKTHRTLMRKNKPQTVSTRLCSALCLNMWSTTYDFIILDNHNTLHKTIATQGPLTCLHGAFGLNQQMLICHGAILLLLKNTLYIHKISYYFCRPLLHTAV